MLICSGGYSNLMLGLSSCREEGTPLNFLLPHQRLQDPLELHANAQEAVPWPDSQLGALDKLVIELCHSEICDFCLSVVYEARHLDVGGVIAPLLSVETRPLVEAVPPARATAVAVEASVHKED